MKSLTNSIEDLQKEASQLLSSASPSSLLQLLLSHHKSVEIKLLDQDENPIHGRTLLDRAIQKTRVVAITVNVAPRAEFAHDEAPKQENLFEQIQLAFRSAQQGRPFVALKWFRDTWLPQQPWDWTKDPELVKSTLKSAIETGVLRTTRLPNPNNPNHPTTTLQEGANSLSTGSRGGQGFRKFSPLEIPGEPLSQTVMRGR